MVACTQEAALLMGMSATGILKKKATSAVAKNSFKCVRHNEILRRAVLPNNWIDPFPTPLHHRKHGREIWQRTAVVTYERTNLQQKQGFPAPTDQQCLPTESDRAFPKSSSHSANQCGNKHSQKIRSDPIISAKWQPSLGGRVLQCSSHQNPQNSVSPEKIRHNAENKGTFSMKLRKASNVDTPSLCFSLAKSHVSVNETVRPFSGFAKVRSTETRPNVSKRQWRSESIEGRNTFASREHKVRKQHRGCDVHSTNKELSQQRDARNHTRIKNDAAPLTSSDFVRTVLSELKDLPEILTVLKEGQIQRILLHAFNENQSVKRIVRRIRSLAAKEKQKRDSSETASIVKVAPGEFAQKNASTLSSESSESDDSRRCNPKLKFSVREGGVNYIDMPIGPSKRLRVVEKHYFTMRDYNSLCTIPSVQEMLAWLGFPSSDIQQLTQPLKFSRSLVWIVSDLVVRFVKQFRSERGGPRDAFLAIFKFFCDQRLALALVAPNITGVPSQPHAANRGDEGFGEGMPLKNAALWLEQMRDMMSVHPNLAALCLNRIAEEEKQLTWERDHSAVVPILTALSAAVSLNLNCDAIFESIITKLYNFMSEENMLRGENFARFNSTTAECLLWAMCIKGPSFLIEKEARSVLKASRAISRNPYAASDGASKDELQNSSNAGDNVGTEAPTRGEAFRQVASLVMARMLIAVGEKCISRARVAAEMAHFVEKNIPTLFINGQLTEPTLLAGKNRKQLKEKRKRASNCAVDSRLSQTLNTVFAECVPHCDVETGCLDHLSRYLQTTEYQRSQCKSAASQNEVAKVLTERLRLPVTVEYIVQDAVKIIVDLAIVQPSLDQKKAFLISLSQRLGTPHIDAVGSLSSSDILAITDGLQVNFTVPAKAIAIELDGSPHYVTNLNFVKYRSDGNENHGQITKGHSEHNGLAEWQHLNERDYVNGTTEWKSRLLTKLNYWVLRFNSAEVRKISRSGMLLAFLKKQLPIDWKHWELQQQKISVKLDNFVSR